MSSIIIAIDDQFVKADPQLLRSLSPGVIKAKGVFETMKADSGRIYFFLEHMRRLKKGLRMLGLKDSISVEEIKDSIDDLMKCNHLKLAKVRVMVWQEGKKQRSAVICESFKPYKRAKKFKVIISNLNKELTRFSHLKTLDYSVCRKSFLEAKKQGADESVLFNKGGMVVEGSRSNIFFVKEGALMTPDISCGCLDGTIRKKVIKIARSKNILVRKVKVNKKDFLESDEIFLTNSLHGIMPVAMIEGKILAKGKIGRITSKLSKGLDILFDQEE